MRKVGLALESGMLSEISWAIDYLSVLTHDPLAQHIDVSRHPKILSCLMKLFVMYIDELMETMSGNENIKSKTDNCGFKKVKKETENYGIDMEKFPLKAENDIKQELVEEHIKDDKSKDPHTTHTFTQYYGSHLRNEYPCVFALQENLDNKYSFYNPVLHYNTKITESLEIEKENLENVSTKFPDTLQKNPNERKESSKDIENCKSFLDSLSIASNLSSDVKENGEDIFNNLHDKQDFLSRRCICISNILRNLSMQLTNEKKLAANDRFICLAGHYLLFEHTHKSSSESPLSDPDLHDDLDKIWWMTFRSNIRSNFMVALSSIASHICLADLPTDTCLQLVNSLLHWAICTSSEALDLHSGLSISLQRIVFETLTKLCMQPDNTDLILATPPFSRLVRLVQYSVEVMCLEESEVERDILLGLLSRLVEGDSRIARILVLDGTAPLLLISLIENYLNTLLMREQSRYMEGFNVSEQFVEVSSYTACKASEIFRSLTAHPANLLSLSKFKKHLLDISTSNLQDDSITNNICHVIATLC